MGIDSIIHIPNSHTARTSSERPSERGDLLSIVRELPAWVAPASPEQQDILPQIQEAFLMISRLSTQEFRTLMGFLRMARQKGDSTLRTGKPFSFEEELMEGSTLAYPQVVLDLFGRMQKVQGAQGVAAAYKGNDREYLLDWILWARCLHPGVNALDSEEEGGETATLDCEASHVLVMTGRDTGGAAFESAPVTLRPYDASSSLLQYSSRRLRRRDFVLREGGTALLGAPLTLSSAIGIPLKGTIVVEPDLPLDGAFSRTAIRLERRGGRMTVHDTGCRHDIRVKDAQSGASLHDYSSECRERPDGTMTMGHSVSHAPKPHDQTSITVRPAGVRDHRVIQRNLPDVIESARAKPPDVSERQSVFRRWLHWVFRMRPHA